MFRNIKALLKGKKHHYAGGINNMGRSGCFMDKAMFVKICMTEQIEGDKSNSGFIDHIFMKNG